MTKDKPEEVEILDDDVEFLETNITARKNVRESDTMNMDGWEETPGLGYYLGDGVYV